MGDLLHRGRASAVIDERICWLRAGQPMVLVIEGDRGSGKSALLRTALQRFPAVVLRASCHGAERGFTFGVVSQLFDRLPPGDLRPAHPPPVVAVPPAGESPEHDLLNRFYRMVRTMAEAGPVVLAIDDVHHADPLSARWCSYLARRLDDLPVGLVVTVRSGELRLGPDGWTAGELLNDLAALAHSRMLRTGPLCADCAGTLIARRLGADVDPAFARQCFALTRGNPQILSAVAARLATAPDADPSRSPRGPSRTSRSAGSGRTPRSRPAWSSSSRSARTAR